MIANVILKRNKKGLLKDVILKMKKGDDYKCYFKKE